MYVDTMTIEQIKKEIESVMKNVCRKCADILGNKNYKRVCLKLDAEERHVFKRVDFSHNGIKYHIIPFVDGKHDYKKRGMNSVLFATFIWKGGLWAVLIADNLKPRSFYTPHFFDRFIERNKVAADGTLDIMTSFFIKNSISTFDDYKHGDYKDSVFVAFEDGVGFGTKFDGYVVFKTFVSEKMLFENQQKIYDDYSWKRELYILNKAV